MPGTHYDNDHSFISELLFSYKKGAYLILRESPLELMMIDYRNGMSKYFSEIEEPLESEVKRAISACIIAKITSFEATLFIGKRHRQFLAQLIIKHVNSFTNEEMGRAEILEYLAVNRKKTYQWLLAFEAFEGGSAHDDA